MTIFKLYDHGFRRVDRFLYWILRGINLFKFHPSQLGPFTTKGETKDEENQDE